MSNPAFIDVHCGFGKTVTAPDWNDAETIRDTLRMRGIGMAFLTSALARDYDPIAGNDELVNAVGDDPEEGEVDLRGWLVMHPGRLEEAQSQMRKFLLGDRFVGAALFADPLTGIPVSARSAADSVTSFRRYAKPLLIHTPTAAAMYEAVRLAQDYSGVRMIASGMGGDEWRESIDMAAKPLNLMLDISGALCPEKIDYAYSVIGGVRKLLFASGAPGTDPAAVLSMLFEANLTEDDRAKVLYANAQRLFGFSLHDDEEAPSLAPMGGL